MEVYIVYEYQQNERYMIDICSTKEKAEKVVAMRKEDFYDSAKCRYFIRTYLLDNYELWERNL